MGPIFFDGLLCGFKWIGGVEKVLLSVGPIDEPHFRNDPRAVIKTLTLNNNQRLVGMQSGSRGE